MRLSKKINEISIEGAQDGAVYGIENSPKAAYVLSTNIYSQHRTMEAFAREIVTNGQDAHIDAGCPEKPLIIHLPTKLAPFFSVQDYGTGMTGIMVERLIGNYFVSLSAEKEQATGYFGLGSKSPFAYTSMFSVESIKDGISYVFQCYKDENDQPRLNLLSQEQTDRPNGVLVTVPVEISDIQKFEPMAIRTYCHLLQMPVFKGNDISAQISELQTTFKEKATLSGEGWSYYSLVKGDSAPVPAEELRKGFNLGRDSAFNSVVLGSVSYPLDFEAMQQSKWDRTSDLDLSKLKGLVLHLDIEKEAIDVDPGREKLQFSEQTCIVIEQRLRQVITDVRKHLKINNGAKTRWAIMAFLNDKMGGDPLMLIAGTQDGHAKLSYGAYPFDDVKLSLLVTQTNMTIKAFRFAGKDPHTKKQLFSEVVPSENLHVMIKTSRSLNRDLLRTYMFSKKCSVLILESRSNGPVSREKAADTLKWLGNPVCVDESAIQKACSLASGLHKEALNDAATLSFLKLCTQITIGNDHNGYSRRLSAELLSERFNALKNAESKGTKIHYFLTPYRDQHAQMDSLLNHYIKRLGIMQPGEVLLMIPPQAKALITGFECLIEAKDELKGLISTKEGALFNQALHDAVLTIAGSDISRDKVSFLLRKLDSVADMVTEKTWIVKNLNAIKRIFSAFDDSAFSRNLSNYWAEYPELFAAATKRVARYKALIAQGESLLDAYPLLGMMNANALRYSEKHEYEKQRQTMRDYVRMVQREQKESESKVVHLKRA
ncbi:hypothetical protein YA0089_24975 [Pseudomonas viridiflava]|uniref:hypothetical protein n=1 Tax=Pseudomonas viridiflava TaxID=33069 RepID=UPI0018E5DA85|nr:hypothetical protein [Pseudomonas viridiflava]MBI6726869.1 hypothetical protein [Pseudomonas viridiflava]